MMDVAIVQNKNTSRARVWIGERNDEFSKKPDKALRCDRPRNYVVCNDTVKCNNWKNGISLPSNKKPALKAVHSSQRPAFAST